MAIMVRRADGYMIGKATLWVVQAKGAWYGLVEYADGTRANTPPQDTERKAWVKAGEMAFAESYDAWLEKECGW